MQPFLVEAIASLDAVRGASPGLSFRWRPHPADDPGIVGRVLEETPWLLRSEHAELVDDVDWADIVVTSVSSVFIEALFADLPVLLHVIPDIEGTAALDFVDPSRQFFYAKDGAARLAAVLEGLPKGEDVLAPDRAALRGCFDGDPRRFDAVSVCLGHATPKETLPLHGARAHGTESSRG
jgi:hypothetical protein